jgi:hypothetical protein
MVDSECPCCNQVAILDGYGRPNAGMEEIPDRLLGGRVVRADNSLAWFVHESSCRCFRCPTSYKISKRRPICWYLAELFSS